MTTAIRLLLLTFALLLLLAAGAWWYLFGPNTVLAAELLPADTMALLTIPNAAKLTVGYETSQVKKLVDAPNAKPLIDMALNLVGKKNVELVEAFLPNLSGQSFIAVTRFDPDKPEQMGFIAGMKPKPGFARFDSFVEKLKATYPEILKQGTTGTGNVAGVDYQWIRGPGAADKICVAKYNGWIVTSWGEDSLRDWLERLQKKSTAPSLAQNPDYQKSLERAGADSAALVYINTHALAPLLESVARRQPSSSDYLEKRLGSIGGIALGARFEQGEIKDRFSFLMPRQAQLDAGLMPGPCAFETLKFTGSDTRFYWAFNLNWPQVWKAMQDHSPSSPLLASLVSSLQTWAQGAGLDIQHNIVEALGPEFSAQLEWGADTTYPEAGLFVKVDKPDDFKPTIAAIINSARKSYETLAVINEIAVDDHHYATLKFVQTSPVNPTITEDGDYFGVFLTENQAVRSFKREAGGGLLHHDGFLRQIGDRRNGASQVLFLDTPQLLDRGYRTALPYISIAGMLNKNLGTALKERPLPPDLAWLAPMGSWALVTSSDDTGLQGYSSSGIGNQGIFIAGGLGAAGVVLQNMGFGFRPGPAPSSASPPTAPAPPPPPPPPPPDAPLPASPSSNATSSTPEQPPKTQ